jgi:hypothetical protein
MLGACGVLVGPDGLEPSASPLSGVRSNRAELWAPVNFGYYPPPQPPNAKKEPVKGSFSTIGSLSYRLVMKLGIWVWGLNLVLKYLTFLIPVPFILKTETPFCDSCSLV